MFVEDYRCNRYFGLSLETVMDPLSCCLGCAWFGTCCNFIPIVILLKILFWIVPISLIMGVISAGYSFCKTPEDITNTFLFFWNTKLAGPHVKLAVFIIYPFFRLFLPILQLFALPIVFTFSMAHRPFTGTYSMEKNYFTGGLEEIYHKATLYAKWSAERFVFRDVHSPPDDEVRVDVPFFQMFVGFYQVVAMSVIGMFIFCVIFPGFSFVMIPFSLYNISNSVVRARRIGPNLKTLFMVLVFPFLVLFPIILFLGGIIASVVFVIPVCIYFVGRATLKSYGDDFDNVFELFRNFFLRLGRAWEKFFEGAGEIINGFQEYHTNELYEWLVENLVEFEVPPGEEAFDIPLLKLFFSVLLGIFCAVCMGFGIVGLTVLKIIPNLVRIYYYCLYKFYIEYYVGGIVRIVVKAIQEGGITKKYFRCTGEVFKFLYQEATKGMWDHIQERIVLTSGPLFCFYVTTYLPCLCIFPVIYVLFTISVVVVMLIVYLVIILFSVIVLPILLLVGPGVLYFIGWLIVCLGSIAYGMKGAYYSYKGDNLKDFFLFPIFFVLTTIYYIDWHTNDWFIDGDAYSLVPCFRIDDDTLLRMDYDILD